MLFDLRSDPGEEVNVLESHPDVAAELKTHVEALVGQPLPAVLNEVCDPESAPMAHYLRARTC